MKTIFHWGRFRPGSRAALTILAALAAACSDGVVQPESPGGGTPPAAVATVEVAPDTVQLQVGGTRALSATPRARDGSALTGRGVAWRSSDASVVRIDLSGNVTALREGTVTITASSEGKEGRARVQVSPPPAVASVQISGGGVEIEPGQWAQLTATARAQDGSLLTDRTITWTSSDTTVATVSADGRVLALRGGTVTITAASEGKTGEARVGVPLWMLYTLQGAAGGQALPFTIRTTRTVVEKTEAVTVTRERRLKLSAGLVWFSTVDGKYRQRFTLQTWERTVTVFSGGDAIATFETLVDTREIRDQGATNGFYDVFTGEPFYASSTFAGHQFTAPVTATDGRSIRQPLPGEEMDPVDLVFAK